MSPVFNPCSGRKIEPLGINLVVEPAPGLSIVIVFPIPVSFAGLACDVPIEFYGLKYISLSSVTAKLVIIPDEKVNTLGTSSRIVD